ncbi:MAG TPA: autotransporter-associated beta strand repeat-containing protein [Rhabdochlamydiaceae bacterium]|nr:autotransporter-associated beta strand repeat-containing protein [Rhabdochlamydiaceae bacterium]
MFSRKAFFILSMLSAASLSGTEYTWQGVSGGVWSTAGNWTPTGGPPSTSSDTAAFSVSANNYVVNVDANFTVSALTFNNTGTFFLNTLPGVLTLNGTVLGYAIGNTSTADVTVNVPLTLTYAGTTIQQGSSGRLLFTLGIGEEFANDGIDIIPTTGSPGNIVFSAATSYNGETFIAGGVLQAGAANVFSASSFFDLLGGTLDLNGFNNTVFELNTAVGATALLGGATLTLNHGGTVDGSIGSISNTTGSIDQLGSTLTLTATNYYTGGTTVGATSTVALTGAGQLAPTGAVAANGTFDISGASSAQTIGNLTGGAPGIVNLGSNGLTVNVTSPSTFSGTLEGSGGTFTKTGSSTEVLAGTSSYTGLTTVSAGTLQAGSSTGFPSNTVYTVNGTLDFNGFSFTINSFTGSGTVTSSSGTPTLTVSSGGTFSGGITGSLGLTLSGSTLNLSGSSLSTYTGTTTINSGASLSAGAAGVFSSGSAVTDNGTLALNNFANTIGGLSGSGLVTTGGTSGILSVADGGSFSGAISGTGGLTIEGGVLTLSGTSNTYSGPTIIDVGATLKQGAAGAFSSNSPITDNGTLDINGFNYTMNSLTGSGTVTSSSGAPTLTVSNGGSFSGALTGSLALTLPGSTLTLNGSSLNTYSGTTTIDSGAILSAGAAGVFSSSSAVTDNGTLALNNFANTIGGLSGSGLVTTGGTSGILTIADGGSFSGQITGAGGLILTGGTLTLSGTSNTYSGATTIDLGATLQEGAADSLSPNTAILIDGTLALNNFATTLTSFTGSGMVTTGGTSGILTLTNGGSFSGGISGAGGLILSGGTLFLSGTTNSYSGATTIDVGTTLNAEATNALSASSAVTDNGTLALNNFANTIGGLSGSGLVTTGGTSGILTVADGGNFSGAIIGAGGLSVTGGTLTLSGTSNSYTGPTTVSLSGILGAGAQNAFSPSSAVTLNGAGQLHLNSFNNTIFSLSSSSPNSAVVLGTGVLTINGGETTTFAGHISNAPCGGLTISGGTNLTLTNTNTYCGPTSILNGTLQLGTNGALSPNSDVTIASAGTLINLPYDSNTANSITNAGTLITSSTLNSTTTYTQTGTLQLNITSLPYVFGNLAVGGAASISNRLDLNALPGSGSSMMEGEVVTLISAAGGVSGTYSEVNFINFPLSVIPAVAYLPTSVVLEFEFVQASTIITPTTIGTVPNLPLNITNIVNTILGGYTSDLGYLIIENNTAEENFREETEEGYGDCYDNGYEEGDEEGYEARKRKKACKKPQSKITLAENVLVAKANPFSLAQVWPQKEELAEKVAVKKAKANPSRFYIGPMDVFGKVNSRGMDQIGCAYNSIGFLTGFDHAFKHWGIGYATQYSYTSATNAHHAGYFNFHHLQPSLYATWVPSFSKYLAFDAIIGGSLDAYNVYRNTGPVSVPLTAKSKTFGTEADAVLGMEYFVMHRQLSIMPKNLSFIPLFNAQYIWLDMEGFREKNADVYSIQVGGQQIRSLRTCLGMRLDYVMERKNITFEPELFLAWQREFLDHSRHIRFKTINMPIVEAITIKNVGAGRNNLLLELNLRFKIKKVFELEAQYDFQWNSLYRNNTFYLSLGGNF